MSDKERTKHDIISDLTDVISSYMQAGAQASTVRTTELIGRGEAQVRFVRTMVKFSNDDRYHPLGEAWIIAGRRFLAEWIERDETQAEIDKALDTMLGVAP